MFASHELDYELDFRIGPVLLRLSFLEVLSNYKNLPRCLLQLAQFRY